MLDRRTLIGRLALGTLTVARAAVAQPAGNLPRVGYLASNSATEQAPFSKAFREGLIDGGYAEGRNIAIEYRFADRSEGRLREMAAELVRLNMDVIVANGSAAFALRTVTSVIPVVFVAVSDPVGAGFAVSLARPGRNFTGLSYLGVELHPKRLELLKAAVPRAHRIGVLSEPAHPQTPQMLREVGAAARVLRIELLPVSAHEPVDLDGAFDTLDTQRADALIVLTGPMFYGERKRLADLALKHRLPSVYEATLFVDAGGLLSYGPDLQDMSRRAAGFVDKILKGTKPADLPVEQPTKFDLVVNLKTAKVLGLTIPPSLLGRASRVIGSS